MMMIAGQQPAPLFPPDDNIYCPIISQFDVSICNKWPPWNCPSLQITHYQPCGMSDTCINVATPGVGMEIFAGRGGLWARRGARA